MRLDGLDEMTLATPWWLFCAVFAPALLSAATLWLPRSAVGRRVALTLVGHFSAFLLVIIHLSRYGVARLGTGGHDGHSEHAPSGATAVIHWVDSVNLNLAFLADGLGAFFALLVGGVGTLIVLYARGYFGPDRDALYRFYPTLGFFTTAMMGIVLSDSMLATILFWEMTSISSFLLIGWEREDKSAVKKAMQAFFTTGLGGVICFGGVLLFGSTHGIWRWSELLTDWTPVIDTPTTAAFGLMLFGAATKSAQWPWHYWLPGAMAAPTPVSAYLHSATMVKAGVFLVARMFPAFSELPAWPVALILPGAITMVWGAVTALNQHDLKRIFAYTTVSQLGLLMCVYGLGALGYMHDGHGLAAIDLDLSQIANHAFYKAPLFLLAGAVAHIAGVRMLPKLHGFAHTGRTGLIMSLLMALAAYALAGGPGTISFPAKEAFLYAIYHAFEVHWSIKALAAAAVVAAACNVAIFVRLTTTLFALPGGLREPHGVDDHAHGHGHHDDHHHDSPFWSSMLWVPAALLVAFQYLGGLLPATWNAAFLTVETNLNYEGFAAGMPALWELHVGVPLLLSMVAIAAGLALGFSPIARGVFVDPHDRIFPALYWLAVTGGGRAFRTVQTGNYRHYVVVVLVTLLSGMIATAVLDPRMLEIAPGSLFEFFPGLLLGILICATALLLPAVKERVVRVLMLGSCGFAVVGMYLLYQAPDLALTQLLFEIISVILFVLVLRMLPEPVSSVNNGRLWRAALATAVGLAMGWMTLVAAGGAGGGTLGTWFTQHSHYGTEATAMRGGGGDNVVNVILVDFRGFDTLGEITVLALAALGVWSLLPGRQSRRDDLTLRSGKAVTT